MHTAKAIETMNNQAACKIAEDMAVQMFGHDRFKAALAELVGVKRQTVNNWFSNRPPTVVILYLQSELDRRHAQRRIEGFRAGILGILNKS